MDLDVFRLLRSSTGQGALAAALAMQPTEATLLACHQRLRKQFPDDIAKAAIETVLLRRKAAAKFSRADRMYFTREALEQSSSEEVALYRAQRFKRFAHVGDFCCGIGGDAIGLAGVAQITAIDSDSLRLAMAQENLRVYGLEHRATFIAGDLLNLTLPDIQAGFFDPDRRAGGQRRVRIRDYVPNLESVRSQLSDEFPLGVKVAPAVPWDDLNGYEAEAEFISLKGELKECVLWFGSLRMTKRRATILPQAVTLAAEQPAEPSLPGPPLRFLYDPDPAIIRAGLVANLGQLLNARPIDESIAYLTSDTHVQTPFARCYAIEERMPFNARELGTRLRALDVGHVTMTKRGSAVELDDLRRKWRLSGGQTRTVILTRVLGRPFALIARPCKLAVQSAE